MAVSTLEDVDAGGNFKRLQSIFRNRIEVDGPYPPATGRYILYVSYLCPWASRCTAVRRIKGLESAIALVVASPLWEKTRPEHDDHEGWVFDASYAGCTPEPHGFKSIRDVYDLSLKNSGMTVATTRYTVPVLFDTVTQTIVNNESSEIIRFFNRVFNDYADHPEIDLCPDHLLPQIDAVNDATYETVCNGVYKCGFAQSQEAYNSAVGTLFETLDRIDHSLSQQRYLVPGHSTPTEADVRLFVCLVRFDEVYSTLFKCNKKLIREYRFLSLWLRDVFQTLDLAPTVRMDHIKPGYYALKSINPYGIVPIGGNTMDSLTLPHGRETVGVAVDAQSNPSTRNMNIYHLAAEMKVH